MHHSADLLPHFEKMTACAFTQRAKQAMDSVCELLTTSQPHFVLCFKPSKVNSPELSTAPCWRIIITFYAEWEKEF